MEGGKCPDCLIRAQALPAEDNARIRPFGDRGPYTPAFY